MVSSNRPAGPGAGSAGRSGRHRASRRTCRRRAASRRSRSRRSRSSSRRRPRPVKARRGDRLARPRARCRTPRPCRSAGSPSPAPPSRPRGSRRGGSGRRRTEGRHRDVVVKGEGGNAHASTLTTVDRVWQCLSNPALTGIGQEEDDVGFCLSRRDRRHDVCPARTWGIGCRGGAGSQHRAREQRKWPRSVHGADGTSFLQEGPGPVDKRAPLP